MKLYFIYSLVFQYPESRSIKHIVRSLNEKGLTMQSDGRKHAVKVVPKKAKFRKGTFGTFTSSTILSSCRYFGSTRRLTGPPSFLKRDLVGCNRVVGERLIPNSSQSPPKANSGIRPRVTAQKLYLAPWDGKASH